MNDDADSLASADHSSPAARTRVLLVGHRWNDADTLSAACRRALPDCVVRRANTEEELRDDLPEAKVVLVSHTLYGKFSDANGADLVERCRTSADIAPSTDGATMLILAYDDAATREENDVSASIDAKDIAGIEAAVRNAFA
jgi:hypothetical protein